MRTAAQPQRHDGTHLHFAGQVGLRQLQRRLPLPRRPVHVQGRVRALHLQEQALGRLEVLRSRRCRRLPPVRRA
jgi:hypothetical protein